MRKGSVLIITLGVIVVLFLISIFVFTLVNNKLQTLKFEQKKLQNNNIVRSTSYLMINKFKDLYNEQGISEGDIIYFEIPDFNGQTYCKLDKLDQENHIATVTCFSKKDDFEDHLTFSIALNVNKQNVFEYGVVSLGNFELGTHLAIIGDILVNDEIASIIEPLIVYDPDKVASNKISIFNGKLYVVSDLNLQVLSTPSNLENFGTLTIGNNSTKEIDTSREYDKIEFEKNNGTLEIDVSNGDVVLAIKEFINNGNNNTIKLYSNYDEERFVVLYLEGANNIAKNHFSIEAEKSKDNIKLLIYSDKEIELEFKNNSRFENTYFFIPNGTLILKNAGQVNNLDYYSIGGSVVAKEIVVQNNAKVKHILPPNEFIEYINQFVKTKYEELGLVDSIQLLGWSKWRKALQLSNY